MSNPFAFSFPGGELKQEVTSVTLVNNTVKTVDVPVPAGKKWVLKSIKTSNPDDVARGITWYKYKEAGKTNLIYTMFVQAALGAAGVRVINSTMVRTTNNDYGYIPDEDVWVAGNTLSIVWAAGGASAGGTDADGLIIEYLEIDA